VKSSPVHFYVERKQNYSNPVYGEENSIITFLLNLMNSIILDTVLIGLIKYSGLLSLVPISFQFGVEGYGRLRSTSIANIAVKLNNRIVGEVLSSHETMFGSLSYQFTRKNCSQWHNRTSHARWKDYSALFYGFNSWSRSHHLISNSETERNSGSNLHNSISFYWTALEWIFLNSLVGKSIVI